MEFLTTHPAFSTNACHIILVASSIHFIRLDPSSEFYCRSSVVAGRIRIVKHMVFEVVRPNIQPACSCRFCTEIMTRVFDDQAKVLVSCEIDGKLYLEYGSDIDRIRWIGPKGAVVIVRPHMRWYTGRVLIQLSVDRRRVIGPCARSVSYKNGQVERRCGVKEACLLKVRIGDPMCWNPSALLCVIIIPVFITRRCYRLRFDQCPIQEGVEVVPSER